MDLKISNEELRNYLKTLNLYEDPLGYWYFNNTRTWIIASYGDYIKIVNDITLYGDTDILFSEGMIEKRYYISDEQDVEFIKKQANKLYQQYKKLITQYKIKTIEKDFVNDN